MTKEIDIVFAPIPDSPNLTFVEVESPPNHSIRFGQWVDRKDGFAVLRFYAWTVPQILDALDCLSWEDKERVLDRLDVLPCWRD